MPPKSNVPIRICGSKTRSGCRTCKQRHVKCDEQKPICSKCQKGDRKCAYDDPQAHVASTTASSHKTPVQSAPPVSRRPVYATFNVSISPYGTHHPSEISAVRHFEAWIGRELAGGFCDHVWRNIIPRVAQYEPTIWYAMTAIGTLDQSIRNDTQHGRSTSIKQYGKAMRELNTCLGSSGGTCRQDVILLSCLLLAIYECLQNNLYSALKHMGGGMKLLIEWETEGRDKTTPYSRSYLNRKSLLPIFLSLDSHAVQMGAVVFRTHGSLSVVDDHLQGSSKFKSVQDAHLSLNYMFNRISHWAVWVPPSIGYGQKPSGDWMATEKLAIQSQFVKWDDAFQPFLLKDQPEPAVFLLMTQRKVLQAFFGKELDGYSELEWDKYFPLFLEAIEHAETYMMLAMNDIQSHSSGSLDHVRGPPSRRPRFTVSMDLVLSLFLMSSKCRDSHLRRRALKMLRTYDCKEGIWDSYQCSLLAEKIIELEENASLEDGFVPEHARVYEMDVRLEEDTVTSITYRRLVRDEATGLCTEVVEPLVLQ